MLTSWTAALPVAIARACMRVTANCLKESLSCSSSFADSFEAPSNLCKKTNLNLDSDHKSRQIKARQG